MIYSSTNSNLENKDTNLISKSDVNWIINVFVNYWYLHIFFFLLSLFLGILYNHKKNISYTSKIEILLKSNEVYDYQENLQNNLGFYNLFGDIENQKRIILSYDLMKKVIKKVDLSCSYFIVGRVKTKEFYKGLPYNVKVNVLNSNLYEKDIDFKILDNERYQLIFSLDNEKVEVVHYFDSVQTTNNYSIITSLNHSPDFEGLINFSNINYKVVFHEESYWINKILSNIEIQNVDYTTLLSISLKDDVPERANQILNILAREYINYTLENQFRINENTMSYINRQLVEVVNIIDSLQLDLEKIRDKKEILDVDKESDKYFQLLMTHKSNERKLKLKVKTLENLAEHLINLKSDNILPPSIYVTSDDGYLKKSINKFYETQLKKIEMTHEFKSGHQELLKIQNKLINQRSDLLDYINNLINAVNIEIETEIKEISFYKSLVRKIPISERDLASFQRKIQVNEKLYEFLLEKRASTFISKSGIIPQTKVIEKARNIGSNKNEESKTLMLFLILGLIISTFISIIYKLFFEKITQVKELNDITNMPLIGGLPFVKNLDEILNINIKAKNNFVESLRTIRTATNFLLSKQDDTLKSFLITSIHPGEGKTFTTINLARIFASSGRKVLVLDFDMHKPKVHKTLKISNELGNSTILSGKSDINNSLNKIEENFYVIPSGPIPPNPSELVLSDNMKKLFHYAQKEFDYVFIDTPPIGLISDALNLSIFVDHSIFVLNTKKASKKGLNYLNEMIGKSNIESYGLILNGIKKRKFSYYYGKYGYGYGYGYGYA